MNKNCVSVGRGLSLLPQKPQRPLYLGRRYKHQPCSHFVATMTYLGPLAIMFSSFRRELLRHITHVMLVYVVRIQCLFATIVSVL